MYNPLTVLLDRLDSPAISGTGVLRWSSPVVSFGDPSNSTVATLGLNPSNREFVNEFGAELDGRDRRFHTLDSLGLKSWSEADARHLEVILQACNNYFDGNPYDRWFKVIDGVIAGANASYYDAARRACHLDLIPYATGRKWALLTPLQRAKLLDVAGDTLGVILREATISILVLNGAAVVDHFQTMTGIFLDEREMPEWSLPRYSAPAVRGFAYSGYVDRFAGVDLGRSVLVLGFNHNLQSSFGVTAKVLQSIRNWIREESH